jgi:predicted negative regulator of RcsB-dependent stress response
VTPSPGIIDASAQRLIDLGLSGVALLALGWFCWQLWQAREKDRAKAEERYESVQEKRITEQRAALDAVSKAVNTLDTAIETLTRSHQ